MDVDSFATAEVDRGREHQNIPWLAALLTRDIGYHGHIQKAALLFFPPNCLSIVKSYEKVYYKTGLRKWMKSENIDDSINYQKNLHCVFCFLFGVLHINCAQYNLEVCVSVIYEGYMTVEMEYHNLTSLIM